jgi:hypothetical protein
MDTLQFIIPADNKPAGKTYTAPKPVEQQKDGTYSSDLLNSGQILPKSFGNNTFWEHCQSPEITSIEDLYNALEEGGQRNGVLIRGEVPVLAKIIRRLYAKNHPASERCIVDVDRAWVAIDVDSAPPIPESIDFFDPEAVGRYVVKNCFPSEYHTVDFVVELTSGHGMKGRNPRLRLFFLLDRPVPNKDLKAFAVAVNQRAGQTVMDPCLYDPGHIHYISPPTFKGLVDPVPVRRMVVKGSERAVAFQTAVEGAGRAYTPIGAQGYAVAGKGFKRALEALAEGGVLMDGAHQAVLGTGAAYSREAMMGLCVMTPQEAATAIRRAISKGLATAKASPREAELSTRFIEGNEVEDILRWCTPSALAQSVAEALAQARWQTGQDIRLKGEYRDDLRWLQHEGKDALDEETARRYATAMLGRFCTHVPKLKPAAAFLAEVTAAYQGQGRGTEEGVQCLAGYWDYLQGLRKELVAQTLNVRSLVANACRMVDDEGKRKTADRVEIIEVDTIEEAQLCIREEGIFVLRAEHGAGKTRGVMAPTVANAPAPYFPARVKGIPAQGPQGLVGVIAHRVSLTREVARVLGTDHYDADKMGLGGIHTKGLTTCIDSLGRADIADHFSRCDTLLMDEWTQTLRTLHTDSQMPPLTAEVVAKRLATLLKNTKRGVLADADITEAGLAFVLEQTGSRKVTIIDVKPQLKLPTIILLDGGAASAFTEMQEQLRQGKCVIFSADSVNKSEQFGEFARRCKDAGLREDDILIINSETIGEEAVKQLIADINSGIVKYRAIAYTPTLGSGISIETAHFDVHYAIYTGTLHPNDFIQLMRRDRTAKEIVIAFDGQAIRYAPIAFRILLDQWIKTNEFDIKISPRGRAKGDITPHVIHRAWTEAEMNRLSNDAHNSLMFLLEARGFSIQRRFVVADKQGYKDVKETVTEAKIKAILAAKEIEKAHDGKQKPMTIEEHRENDKFFIKKQLALAVEQALSREDVVFYDNGAILPQLRRVEILWAGEDWLQCAGEADGARLLPDMRNVRAKKAAYEAVLGVVYGTYQGEQVLTEQSALMAWEVAVRFKEVLENDGFRVPLVAPAHPVKWAKKWVAHMGLEGGGGVQISSQDVEYKSDFALAHMAAGSVKEYKNPSDVCKKDARIRAYPRRTETYDRLVEIAQRRLARPLEWEAFRSDLYASDLYDQRIAAFYAALATNAPLAA